MVITKGAHPLRLIALGQTAFYSALLLCVALQPAGLLANQGVSYYGVYEHTAVAYALGLLTMAVTCLLAAARLPRRQHWLRVGLELFALFITLVLLTPFAISPWVDYLHTGFGTTLFVLQLLLCLWLMRRFKYVWWSVLLFAVALIAALASAYYLKPSHGFLLQSQVIFQMAFGLFLILSLHRLERRT